MVLPLPLGPTIATTSPFLSYELITDMESVKFGNGGKSNVEAKDGGANDNLFEVGTKPGLNL